MILLIFYAFSAYMLCSIPSLDLTAAESALVQRVLQNRSCHGMAMGTQGAGDQPVAPTLRGSFGYSIIPFFHPSKYYIPQLSPACFLLLPFPIYS
jgi:hypothetical protein